MTPVHELGAASPTRRTASLLRFATELGAWGAIGTAFAQISLPLAIAVVLAAIALPTVYATPGDKPQAHVPVPGWVTIAILAATMAGGVAAAWIAWPWWAAAALSALTTASLLAELPRWRWLLTAKARPLYDRHKPDATRRSRSRARRAPTRPALRPGT